MERGILLITDLDGTLLNRKHEISEENIQAIKHFKSKGGLVTFATGRMEESTVQYLEQLDINQPIITYNGGRLYCPIKKEVLQEKQLMVNEGIWETLLSNKTTKGIIIYKDSIPYILERNKIIEEFEAKEGITCEVANVQDFSRGNISKILVIMKALSQTAPVEELVNLEKELLENNHFDTVFSEVNYLEILPTGTTKGLGVKNLIDYLKLEDVYVVAVGDNLNDIPLLESANLGIAVKNARDGLKEVADLVLDKSNDDSAIAYVINEVIPSVSNIINQ